MMEERWRRRDGGEGKKEKEAEKKVEDQGT
jgi:hypothetical protein